MASDKQRFSEAVNHWHELQQARRFSVAPFAGYLAIVCSYYTDIVGAPAGSPRNIAEVETFTAEANALAAKMKRTKRKAITFTNASQETMREILAEPTISDIITIGHGSLSYLYLTDPHGAHKSLRFTELSAHELPLEDKFDWYDAALAATHLKTGLFVQRHCGHAVSDLSVPLGTFVVHDVQNVYAPTLTAFSPASLDDRENEKIEPAYADFDEVPITYETIKSILPRDTGENA